MRKIILLICFVSISMLTLQAEVKLPHIFSDNMLIQRDKPIHIWGWADQNEEVEITFNGHSKKSKADKNGKWNLELSPMKFGGPYVLTVKGQNNTITLNNILIGDVWLCSGQSNMEWTVKDVNNAGMEISSAYYPEIRSFDVVKDMSTTPKDNLNGQWTVCSPETVRNYSAVGYFFARELYKKTGIPIGIINSSWGGTDIETWIPKDAFQTLPAKFSERYVNSSIPYDLETFMFENSKNRASYEQALQNDPGLNEKWYFQSADNSSWKTMAVPQYWSNDELRDADGIVWFKYMLDLPKDVAGKSATIHLGPIDDDDILWINGKKIGETSGYNIDRIYEIPNDILNEGVNTITIRIFDGSGGGGMYGSPEQLYIESGGIKYSLAGDWKYRPSVITSQFNYVNVSPNMAPNLLYNAMINPIVNYPIKGAIWYQGENNAGQAYNYRTLFPLLIQSWRQKWNTEFPFYWVQLANFMKEDEEPVDTEWAELREAQTLTLSQPSTGQAVIIDIGEADDIHPRNKQDVGLRLALIAMNKDYGYSDIVYQGPTYKSMQKDGNKVILTFDNVGGGLVTKSKYGYVNGFSIAGKDKEFVWAKAYIDGDKIVVYNDKISNPVAVRYAWGNNPDVNLYNQEGLPAVPFRTDD